MIWYSSHGGNVVGPQASETLLKMYWFLTCSGPTGTRNATENLLVSDMRWAHKPPETLLKIYGFLTCGGPTSPRNATEQCLASEQIKLVADLVAYQFRGGRAYGEARGYSCMFDE